MKTVIFILLEGLVLGTGLAADVCESPFSNFLGCMSERVEDVLNGYLSESTQAHRNGVEQCFRQAGCTPPNFQNLEQAVGVFITDPEWRERIQTILDLVEDIPHDVQVCMLDHFKGLAVEKIEECVEDFGDASVKDFEMPDIPGLEAFNVNDFADVMAFRLLIRHAMIQCVTPRNEQAIARLIRCVKNQRQRHDVNMCRARENCESRHIRGSCSRRFDLVHEAGCDCGESVRGTFQSSGISGLGSRFGSLKSQIIGGGLERKFRACYAETGHVFPEEQMRAVKQAAIDAVRDIFVRRCVPNEVKYSITVAKNAFKEMGQQWENSFCAECSSGGNPQENEDKEVKQLEQIAEKTREAKESGSDGSGCGSGRRRFDLSSLLGRR